MTRARVLGSHRVLVAITSVAASLRIVMVRIPTTHVKHVLRNDRAKLDGGRDAVSCCIRFAHVAAAHVRAGKKVEGEPGQDSAVVYLMLGWAGGLRCRRQPLGRAP